MSESCENCRFYEHHTDAGKNERGPYRGLGKCRRYPPRHAVAEQDLTRPEHWCGEWQLQEQKGHPVTSAELALLYLYCGGSSEVYAILRRYINYGSVADPPPFI